MASEPNPPNNDEEGIISSKKHKHRSSSAKPPKPFFTRVVRRLRDGCDEFIERMEDMEHGYRDKNGKKTQKGIEHDYEIERRRKKRDAERREKKRREGGKYGEGGGPVEALMSGGRGDPPHHGEHSRRGGHDDEGGGPRGRHDGDPFNLPPMMDGPVHEARPEPRPDPFVPLPAIQDFGRDPPLEAIHPEARTRNSMGSRRRSVSPVPHQDRGRGSQDDRVSQRSDVSPIPSEHSASSIIAQVSARRNEERARIGRQAGRERQAGRGPQAGRENPLDSEDEERPGSDEGSSSEDEGEDEAAKAARARGRAGGPAGGPVGEPVGEPAGGPVGEPAGEPAGVVPPPPSVETAPPSVIGSGLRGGGAAGIEDLGDDNVGETDDEGDSTDTVQYDEREDFDDEYTTAAPSLQSYDSLRGTSEGRIEGTDERENEEHHEEPRQEDKLKEGRIHAQPQEHLQEEPHKMFQSRERRPYSLGAQNILPEVFAGSLPQKKTSERTPRPYANLKVGESTRVRRPEATGNAGARQQHRSDKAKEPSPKQNESVSATDSYSDEDDPTPEPQTRARFNAAKYPEARRHYKSRTGVPQEADLGYDKTGGAGQAKPKMRKTFGWEKEANRFPNRYPDLEDDPDATSYDTYFAPYDARNEQAEATLREQIERNRAAFQERYAPEAASAFRNNNPYSTPYSTPYADRAPKNPFSPGGRYSSYESRFYAGRRGPQPGGRFEGGMQYSGPSGARTFFRTPGKVPENQDSPLRNETYYSQSDSESSDAGDLLEISSASEESSDTDPEPSPRRRRKAPPKPSYDDYSSDDSEPPPRKSAKAKAKAGKTRARSKSPPPRKQQSKVNQGKRRSTTANSPPPPKYNDVVKDTPPNHYARLGLNENASAEEIKKACKKMRVKTHPDQVRREKPNLTEEEMVKVTAVAAKVGEAADVLEDPSQKRDYDEMIRAWKRKHGGRLPKEDE
ncbi:MAG: hypothetical protein L6R42_003887 [Xanthoria sp. 1 TBL-2021]|nr:MAG: hypothetical protein L6R42_003887 [Xanthoria sp. 1 TBL-2021]